MRTIFLLLFAIMTCASATESVDIPAIGVRTITYFDQSRERPIITEILYPADSHTKAKIPEDAWIREAEARDVPIRFQSKKYPLILLSHGGYKGSRLDLIWLAYSLVKKGYIVASVDHYGETYYLPLPKESLKSWQRPLDVSFVLREMLKSSIFKDKIDPEKIGFAGFSMGGLTGIWLAGGKANLYKAPELNDWRIIEPNFNDDSALINNIDFHEGKKSYFDPMIKAVFLMAPACGFIFDETGLSTIKTPTYIISGAEDKVVSVKENAQYFSKNITKSTLNILPGKVGHYVFLGMPSPLGKKLLTPELYKDEDSVNRNQIHILVEEAVHQFFIKNL